MTLQDWIQEKIEWILSRFFKSVFILFSGTWLFISISVWVAERHAANANILNLKDAFWWGIVTAMTVGYGDHYPVSMVGRALACVLMFTGVVSVSLLTARISTFFLEHALREGRGFVNTSRFQNHFIVCGWKDEMTDLLCHILDFNSDLDDSGLVVVANVSPSQIEELRSHSRLKHVHIIAGEYYTESTLKKAAPERARKILILADRTENAAGQTPTVTEVDARTIMTAMTLSHLARGTVVAAEILEARMDEYLKLANVSEVIYSREYSRLLLGNASAGTGVPNIIFHLLDPRTPAFISTLPFSAADVGKTYEATKSQIEKQNPGVVVVGVLENGGNRHSMRELALRRAQRTSDISELLQNLGEVKRLQCNHPVFHPGESYQIPEGALAIVIGNREGVSHGSVSK